jgi:hypothetical protein
MTRNTTTIDYVKSNGNVFADLGLPHPERALLKAGLTLQIYRLRVLADRSCRCDGRSRGATAGARSASGEPR